MLKKFFHNRTVPLSDKSHIDSSFDSGESEIVSPEEIQAATEERYFLRKPFDFAPKSSDGPGPVKECEMKQKTLKSQNLDKLSPSESQMKRSRSFSFRFRPHSSSMFKMPRSKSVHFAEEVQVAGSSSCEPPTSTSIKLSSEVPSEDNRSSSSLYSDETAESSASEDTMKRVGQSLGTIFRKKNISSDGNPLKTVKMGDPEDTDRENETHDEICEVSEIDHRPLSSTSLMYAIYQHLCQILELRPQMEYAMTEHHLETDIHTCIDDLGANLKSTTDIMHSLTSRIKRGEEEAVDLLNELKNLQQKLTLLEKSNEELQEEIDEMNEGKMDSDEREQMHQEFTEAYQEIDKIVACYEKELNECKEELQARTDQILLMKETNDKEEKVLRCEYNEAVERCSHLENMLEAKTSEIKKVRELETLLLRQTGTHGGEIERLGHELKDLKGKLEESESLHQLNESEKAKTTKAFNEEIDQLKCELEYERSARLHLQDSIQSLKLSLEVKTQSCETTKTENTHLHSEVSKLQKKIDDSQEAYQKQFEEAVGAESDKVKKFQGLNLALKGQILELEAQISKVSSQLKNSQQTTLKFQQDFKTVTLKEKESAKSFQAVLHSNTFVVEALRHHMRTTFEIIAPMFHHTSAEEFTQVFYEYSQVQIFDHSHHKMVALLLAFLLAAVRDVVNEYIRVEKLLEGEIVNRQNYQQEVLQMFSKILRLLIGQKKSTDMNRSPGRKAVGGRKLRK